MSKKGVFYCQLSPLLVSPSFVPLLLKFALILLFLLYKKAVHGIILILLSFHNNKFKLWDFENFRLVKIPLYK